MRRVILACVLLAVLPSARAEAQAFRSVEAEIESLMERSPTFRAEFGPVRDRVLVNTTGAVPGDNAAIMIVSGGKATVYIDAGKLPGLTPEELDIVLVHELYGHAVPELSEGQKCEDPGRGQRYLTSCVGKREAKVLREIGMRPRANYSLRGDY